MSKLLTKLSRLGGLAKNLALLLTTLILCFAVLEIGTRVLTDIPPAITERHPVVGKTYRPNFRGNVFVAESGNTVYLRFNREGFRGEDVPFEKGPDVRRIAMIGDSFVAAIAVEEDQTAVVQLERLLGASHPEVRWEVLNFGVSSSSTGQELVLFREVVSRYRPDLVICAYSTFNDFADNSNRLTTQSRVYFELDGQGRLVQHSLSASRAALSGFLNRHSRFYLWQKEATEVFKYRVKETIAPLGTGRWIFSTEQTEDLRDTWELNARLIGAFNDEAEDHGARFVLAAFPCAEQVYDDVWEDVLEQAGELAGHFDPDHPEERLKTICAKRGIPFLPMTNDFRQAAGRRRLAGADPEEWLFLNGKDHFNPAGNRVTAEIIHRFLTEGEGREILDHILPQSGI